jgi:DNA-binding response OmpR family regulator
MVFRVLHIDDCEDIRGIIKLALVAVGRMEVIQFRSAAAAFERIDDLEADLLLLGDCAGPEVLEALRAHRRFSKTPAVFLTAKVDEDAMQRLRAADAAAIVTEPFDPFELSATLSEILRQR